ncbi:unnamed protein product, partial [Polarella glacialis]
MASQGVSVASLLQFWARLGPKGDMMLHYDPQRSSTTDVVRQAMIPLSRLPGQGGQSLAALLRPGRSPMRSRNVLPETMVTHSWANKFLHLVAAVVADALKEDYFGEVAQIMTTV